MHRLWNLRLEQGGWMPSPKLLMGQENHRLRVHIGLGIILFFGKGLGNPLVRRVDLFNREIKREVVVDEFDQVDYSSLNLVQPPASTLAASTKPSTIMLPIAFTLNPLVTSP